MKFSGRVPTKAAGRVRMWSSLWVCTGTPIAYKMMVNAAPQLLALPGSLLAKRGEFATKNLWVTPHRCTPILVQPGHS